MFSLGFRHKLRMVAHWSKTKWAETELEDPIKDLMQFVNTVGVSVCITQSKGKQPTSTGRAYNIRYAKPRSTDFIISKYDFQGKAPQIGWGRDFLNLFSFKCRIAVLPTFVPTSTQLEVTVTRKAPTYGMLAWSKSTDVKENVITTLGEGTWRSRRLDWRKSWLEDEIRIDTLKNKEIVAPHAPAITVWDKHL